MLALLGTAAMIALVFKLTDVAVMALKLSGWKVQVVCWVFAVAVVFLFSKSAINHVQAVEWMKGLNNWALLAIGLGVGSGASVVNDGLDAVAVRRS